MVPSSAANALPIRPAIIIDVITGLNSLAKARAKTPPVDLFNPNLVNSLTNWIPKASPTKETVLLIWDQLSLVAGMCSSSGPFPSKSC